MDSYDSYQPPAASPPYDDVNIVIDPNYPETDYDEYKTDDYDSHKDDNDSYKPTPPAPATTPYPAEPDITYKLAPKPSKSPYDKSKQYKPALPPHLHKPLPIKHSYPGHHKKQPHGGESDYTTTSPPSRGDYSTPQKEDHSGGGNHHAPPQESYDSSSSSDRYSEKHTEGYSVPSEKVIYVDPSPPKHRHNNPPKAYPDPMPPPPKAYPTPASPPPTDYYTEYANPSPDGTTDYGTPDASKPLPSLYSPPSPGYQPGSDVPYEDSIDEEEYPVDDEYPAGGYDPKYGTHQTPEVIYYYGKKYKRAKRKLPRTKPDPKDSPYYVKGTKKEKHNAHKHSEAAASAAIAAVPAATVQDAKLAMLASLSAVDSKVGHKSIPAVRKSEQPAVKKSEKEVHIPELEFATPEWPEQQKFHLSATVTCVRDADVRSTKA
jgi:hypothetical protein